MEFVRKILRSLQCLARKDEKRREELKRKKLMLDCAAMCGDSDRCDVFCERCVEQITVDSNFSVDEDGRAYCEGCQNT